ncbi:MAG: hypothetical protein NZ899_14725 [Thermoguttaceae bacterium]|nr:hypothetical protein [Thermoguttaceae bacterium]MDW8079551.1 hypothetical protein [Thermoguttaceae bacterium]
MPTHQRNRRTKQRKTGRLGTGLTGAFTLAELLTALAITGLIMAACVTLFTAAAGAFRLADSRANLLQEGQACLDRIRRAVEAAYATAEMPGFLVLEHRVGGWDFPQTLIVWHPQGPVNSGRTRPFPNELVIFCPNPEAPEQLLEIRPAAAGGLCPLASDKDAWRAFVSTILSTPGASRVVLTSRLRTAPTGDPLVPRRPGLFFFSTLRPSEADLAQFRAGTRSWKSLPWVHGIHGPQFGLRQHWLRIELQLQNSGDAPANTPQEIIPVFGSVAIYFGMPRS